VIGQTMQGIQQTNKLLNQTTSHFPDEPPPLRPRTATKR